MGTMILAQLGTVPIFLSSWSVELFGLWLVLHSAVLVLPILDSAHHQYLDGEFLRTGEENLPKMNSIFWGGVGVSVFVGGIQFLGTLTFLWLMASGYVHIVDPPLIEQNLLAISIFLGVYAFLWWVLGSTGGILVRYLYPLGFYPRIAWWWVGVAFFESLIPAVVVYQGGGLLDATLAFLATFVLIRGALLLDSLLIARKVGLVSCPIPWADAWVRFFRSLLLAIQQASETLRQQGMRLVLAPLSGTAEMTNFSTVRVGVNAVLQGFTAISTPLIPELMRYVRQRDQEKIESSFATLWILVVAVIIPFSFLLQFFAGDLFALWTGGKIPFDPVVFALLTFGTLLFAISQPALLLVRANNLLRIQLLNGVSAALVLLTAMFLTVPSIGIRGAALATSLAEIVSALTLIGAASSWLNANSLRFPQVQFRLVACSLMLAVIAYLAVQTQSVWKWGIAILVIPAYAAVLVGYWWALPVTGRRQIEGYAASVFRGLRVPKDPSNSAIERTR
jgi:O-antigen/teichoic acid export membrane protein